MTAKSSVVRIVPMAVCLGLIAGVVPALEPLTPTTEVIYAGGETIIGQPFEYPEGPANITGAIITLEAGSERGRY